VTISNKRRWMVNNNTFSHPMPFMAYNIILLHLKYYNQYELPICIHVIAHLIIAPPIANNESSEGFDIIKPGRRVKIKSYRQ